MRKSYKGLVNAMRTSQHIIESNIGLDWESLCHIFINDPIIEPYYFEVTDLLHAGRTSLRFEDNGGE